MTYLDRRLGISVVCVALAGCASNPWFGVTATDESEGTAATDGSADAGSTSEGPPTSGDSVGTGSVGVTTEGETGGTSTGVDPQTTGMTSMTTEPETTQGPGTDAGEETIGESSTGGEEACGNGVVDGGEECDVAVDQNMGCTPECQLPTCGDGFKYEGVEQCDAGMANDNNGLCTLECKNAKCGDGFTQPGEVCDSGPDNGEPVLMGCASDCMGTFQHQLEIRVTGGTFQGLLTKDGLMGVGAADAICNANFPGWRALIVDDLMRIASTTPWSGLGQSPDWVLQPYTIYVNVSQDLSKKLIGVTGKERLLGKEGELLVNPIGLIPAPVWTGLNSDWTASGADCVNWTTKSMEEDGTVGESSAKDGKYLHLEEPAVCIESRRLYCVQQPG